jgi:hypothetical protein
MTMGANPPHRYRDWQHRELFLIGSVAKLLSKDEARRIASNIAKLPEQLRQFRPLPSFPAKLRAGIF